MDAGVSVGVQASAYTYIHTIDTQVESTVNEITSKKNIFYASIHWVSTVNRTIHMILLDIL